jgi:gamma-glutamylcyclotransferase (GGCT)/AIG2-like uncharacterized protein YtfP
MPLLFSYGTLQQPDVQMATFGRLLHATPDSLVRYTLSLLAITDAQVLATSGKAHHPIACYTGNPQHRIDGSAFTVTEAELLHADAYEIADYRRTHVTLASGNQAWVYINAAA